MSADRPTEAPFASAKISYIEPDGGEHIVDVSRLFACISNAHGGDELRCRTAGHGIAVGVGQSATADLMDRRIKPVEGRRLATWCTKVLRGDIRLTAAF